MSNRISQNEKKRVLELFYRGNSRKEIGDIVSHSPASVQRIIKQHERNVRENGLVYELSEEGLTEPLELVRLYGELHRANVSVTDCRDAVPIVQKCRELGLEEGTVNELIDAAVQLGGAEFPRQQFAESLLRILRREKETGRTIEQIESSHQQLINDVRRLQSDEVTLRTNIARLAAQRTQAETDIRSGQQTLAALQSRLARIPVTEAQLETYTADRNFLATFGFNMNDTAKVKVALIQIAGLNYNVATIINELVRIRDLDATAQTLTKNVTDLQASLASLTQQNDNLTKGIQELENKRLQIKKELQKEEEDAHKKIMDLKRKVIEQIIEANATERDLADFVAAREALGKGGVPL